MLEVVENEKRSEYRANRIDGKECASQRSRRMIPSNRQEFVGTYLTYSWKDRKNTLMKMKVFLPPSHQQQVAQAKIIAANLGMTVANKQQRLITTNKYNSPHQGKREMERRAKRMKSNGT